MRENVTISYRGAHYEIGRGQNFYAIWPASAPQAGPIEWWPETPEGWHGAWSRFTSVEAPGTIAPVGPPGTPGQFTVPGYAAGTTQPAPTIPATAPGTITPAAAATPADTAALDSPDAPPSPDTPLAPAATTPGPTATAPGQAGRLGRLGGVLLLLGVAFGVAGLFTGYLSSSTLAHQANELVPHVIYLAGWAAAGVLILLGGTRHWIGALLGTGLSIVTFGLLGSDAGLVIAGQTHLHTGLLLTMIGWLVCAAGSGLALLFRPSRASAATPGTTRDPMLTVALGTLAALGVVAAFAPSWDRFTLRTPAGILQSITAGYAFSNPGAVIAADVIVMVTLVAVVVAATLWRPVQLGAALLAGAVIPMVAQGISAIIQITESVSPAQFGIPPTEAQQAGLTIDAGLTPAFWLFSAFVVALALVCVWMFLPSRRAAVQPIPPAPPAPVPPPPPATPAGAAASTAS